MTTGSGFWRRFGAIVIAVAALAALASCGTSSQPDASSTVPPGEEDHATPVPGGRLVYGIETDPNGLDPTRNAFDPVGIQLANAVYDPIAAYDAAGTPQPYLARDIEPVEGSNFTAWRVALRSGVKFQSGRPLDAQALKTYVEAVTGEYVSPATKTKRSSITQDAARFIERADVVNDEEIIIRMRRPWATFPALLTGQGGYVISPEQIENPEGHSAPDGTGPFILRSWQSGKRFVLARNPQYWRKGLPYLDSVEFAIENNGDERIAQLQRGIIDVMSAGNVGEVQRLDTIVREQSTGRGANQSQIRIERDTGPSEAFSIMLNTAKKPLDNDLLRQALAYATDVEALARDNGWERDRIITGPFPPTSKWYVATDMPRFDLEKARWLVNEYKRQQKLNDVTFELLGIYQPALLNQLAAQWAAAGVHVRVTMTDFLKSVPIAVGGNYDALEYRYFSAQDPDTLYHFWTSETRRPVGQISLNFTRYANDAIDAALVKGRSTTDESVRHEAYATVQREFAKVVPYIWLFRSEWIIARNERVHNARNVSLPDGRPALPFDIGTHRLTETWVSAAS